ncbi:hypothetical protein JAAARDRAFT_538295 [Jaapia argillacea MUCL 33604]|uniref:Uncharacterized protein n=1 Tax=Jaapia argillacea MUCL 33604 TaxID=933084 RepID=A0A067P890_9AGAM|nr:hypothetical protein JAAARDRAFT_538295 [Jaapia argillacea MUCL 33604]
MSCTASPTRTVFETVTSQSLSTSFSNVVSTGPATTVTITSVNFPCMVGDCFQTTVETQPGQVTTVQVPVALTVPIINTIATGTLFAPCQSTTSHPTVSSTAKTSTTSSTAKISSTTTNVSTTTPPPPISPSISTSPTPLPLPPSTSTTTSIATIISIYTPPPSILVLSSTVTTDGSTTVSAETFTSTAPPTTVFMSVPAAAATGEASSSAVANPSNHVAVIVGGAAAGAVGLVVIAGLIWWISRLLRPTTPVPIDHGRNVSSNTAPDRGSPQTQQRNFQSAYHPDPPSRPHTVFIQQQFGVHQQPYQPNSSSPQQTTRSQHQHGLSQQQYNLPSQQAYNSQSPSQTNGPLGEQLNARRPGQTAYPVQSQYSPPTISNSISSGRSSPTTSTSPLITPVAAGRRRQSPLSMDGPYPSMAEGLGSPQGTELPPYPDSVVAPEERRHRSNGANSHNLRELHQGPSDGPVRGGSDIGNGRGSGAGTSAASSAPAYSFVGSSLAETTRSPSLAQPANRRGKLTRRPR